MEFFKKNNEMENNGERFKEIYDQSAVGESIVSLTGDWLDVNKRLCEITGYSKEELVGKNFQSITYPDDKEKSADAIKNLVSGKVSTLKLEKRYLHKNGSIIWVLISIAVCYDKNNKPQYFIAHTQDITEIKKIERELRDLKEKYQTIIEKGNDGIVIIQDNTTKFANSKMFELTGYTPEEIINKPFLQFIAPESLELVKHNYGMRILNKKVPQRYKVLILMKDGNKLPVEISGTFIEYNGKPADMVVLRDISEREKFEKEKEKHISDLERINRLAVDRELKMVELKKEISKLTEQLQKK